MRIDISPSKAVDSLYTLIKAIELGHLRVDQIYTLSDPVVKMCGALVEPLQARIIFETTSLVGETCDDASH